jgi:hypothetical protein
MTKGHQVRRAVISLHGQSKAVVRPEVTCNWSGRTFTVSGKRCPSCNAKLKLPSL